MRKERRYPSGLEHSSEAINESGARTELPNRPAPGTSLIEAIGRKEACELMQDAVLRAIEENRAFGLGAPKRMRRRKEAMACLVLSAAAEASL